MTPEGKGALIPISSDLGRQYSRPWTIRLCFTLFIASQHPDLDAGKRQIGDGLGNAVLKLVFDGGRAEKRHVHLDLFVDFVQQLVALG